MGSNTDEGQESGWRPDADAKATYRKPPIPLALDHIDGSALKTPTRPSSRWRYFG